MQFHPAVAGILSGQAMIQLLQVAVAAAVTNNIERTI
jgi:hypothetical protein